MAAPRKRIKRSRTRKTRRARCTLRRLVLRQGQARAEERFTKTRAFILTRDHVTVPRRPLTPPPLYTSPPRGCHAFPPPLPPHHHTARTRAPSAQASRAGAHRHSTSPHSSSSALPRSSAYVTAESRWPAAYAHTCSSALTVGTNCAPRARLFFCVRRRRNL